MSDNPQVNVPNMCKKHQSLLIHQVGISEDGPWRSLIIMAQIALFQAATIREGIYEKLNGDISKLDSLGCLACYMPDKFGEIVDTAIKEKSLKLLGEKWIEQAKTND